MSKVTTFEPNSVPSRFSVPVFVRESTPVPEITSLIVRRPVWLNCSVPLAVMAPVTVAPSLRSTVSPGAIVPPA